MLARYLRSSSPDRVIRQDPYEQVVRSARSGAVVGTDGGKPFASDYDAAYDIIDKEDKIAGKTVPIASTGSMKSVVTQQWHFITHETRGDQIYDWMRDPGEASDLVSTPEGKAATSDLKSEVEGLSNTKKR